MLVTNGGQFYEHTATVEIDCRGRSISGTIYRGVFFYRHSLKKKYL